MSMTSPTTFTFLDSPPSASTLSPNSGYVVLDPQVQLILEPDLRRLLSFSALERGWSAGAGEPISRKAIYTALGLLVEGTVAFNGLPDLMPLQDGGVILEWEQETRAVQISVAHDGGVVFGAIVGSDLVDEGRLSFPIRFLAEWLAKPFSVSA